MKLTYVKCIFKFIFRGREKRRKEKQKIVFNSKKQFGKGPFVIKSAKKSKVWTHALPPYLQISNFGLTSLPLLDVTNWHSIALDYFGKFHKNFNNEIKIVT